MNEILENALKTGKIAGAYLIAGSSPEAAQEQIDEFLLRVFCQTGTGCRTCPGCVKYLRRSHADLFMIEPTKNTISIGDVRDIPAAIAKKPYEGGLSGGRHRTGGRNDAAGTECAFKGGRVSRPTIRCSCWGCKTPKIYCLPFFRGV